MPRMDVDDLIIPSILAKKLSTTNIKKWKAFKLSPTFGCGFGEDGSPHWNSQELSFLFRISHPASHTHVPPTRRGLKYIDWWRTNRKRGICCVRSWVWFTSSFLLRETCWVPRERWRFWSWWDVCCFFFHSRLISAVATEWTGGSPLHLAGFFSWTAQNKANATTAFVCPERNLIAVSRGNAFHSMLPSTHCYFSQLRESIRAFWMRKDRSSLVEVAVIMERQVT